MGKSGKADIQRFGLKVMRLMNGVISMNNQITGSKETVKEGK